jgi:hypothetical protein
VGGREPALLPKRPSRRGKIPLGEQGVPILRGERGVSAGEEGVSVATETPIGGLECNSVPLPKCSGRRGRCLSRRAGALVGEIGVSIKVGRTATPS